MAQKILIDLIKLREVMAENCNQQLPEALYYLSANNNGLKTIRELATFRFTCRKCKEAPCIGICPSEALEKDEEGIITRNTNLCVSCKSCVIICPFGTMMTDFFTHHRNKDLLYDLKNINEIRKFIEACPAGTVSLTDTDEMPDNHIFRLNEEILIREYQYNTEDQ
jgi:Fe-S-cluster-containing hydrogenase component 2